MAIVLWPQILWRHFVLRMLVDWPVDADASPLKQVDARTDIIQRHRHPSRPRVVVASTARRVAHSHREHAGSPPPRPRPITVTYRTHTHARAGPDRQL